MSAMDGVRVAGVGWGQSCQAPRPAAESVGWSHHGAAARDRKPDLHPGAGVGGRKHVLRFLYGVGGAPGLILAVAKDGHTNIQEVVRDGVADWFVMDDESAREAAVNAVRQIRTPSTRREVTPTAQVRILPGSRHRTVQCQRGR